MQYTVNKMDISKGIYSIELIHPSLKPHAQTEDKPTDMLLNILVALDTLHHFTKFHSCTHFQSKIILTHVNSTTSSSWCCVM